MNGEIFTLTQAILKYQKSKLKQSTQSSQFITKDCLSSNIYHSKKTCNNVYDVIVVGSGMAALSSLISATATGSESNQLQRILLIEKNPVVGGTTAKSGGVMWIPNNHLMARKYETSQYIEYLNHKQDNVTDRDLWWIRKFIEETPKAFEQFCNLNIFKNPVCVATYHPTCQFWGDYLSQLTDHDNVHTAIPNPLFDRETGFGHSVSPGLYFRQLYPVLKLLQKCCIKYRNILLKYSKKNYKVADLLLTYFNYIPISNADTGGFGIDLVHSMYTYCKSTLKQRLTIRKNCQVTGLLWNNDSTRCIGVIASQSDAFGIFKTKQLFFGSKYGVIFGTGGFAHNPQLRQKYLPFRVYGSCANKSSKGDLIEIIKDYNNDEIRSKKIQLSNLSDAWYTQTTLHNKIKVHKNDTIVNDIENSYAHAVTDTTFFLFGESIIIVNKYGNRFMNEKMSYHNRVIMSCIENDSILSFLICDESVVEKYPNLLNFDAKNALRANNVADLQHKIENFLQQPEVMKLADNTQIEECFGENLVESWNKYQHDMTQRGRDPIYGRNSHIYEQQMKYFCSNTNDKECAIPSFDNMKNIYCIILVPAVMDTKGGPLTNTDSQVLFENGDPVAGLYAVGNCAATFSQSNYYGAGATLSQALVMGYQAGQHIQRVACTQPENNFKSSSSKVY